MRSPDANISTIAVPNSAIDVPISGSMNTSPVSISTTIMAGRNARRELCRTVIFFVSKNER